MAKYGFTPRQLYVPQYKTDATISVDESHPSGHPHLVVRYKKGGYNGAKDFAAAIPSDWTDQDLEELISISIKPPSGRDWPSWEVPSADYAAFSLFRWWKGEEPPKS